MGARVPLARGPVGERVGGGALALGAPGRAGRAARGVGVRRGAPVRARHPAALSRGLPRLGRGGRGVRRGALRRGAAATGAVDGPRVVGRRSSARGGRRELPRPRGGPGELLAADVASARALQRGGRRRGRRLLLAPSHARRGHVLLGVRRDGPGARDAGPLREVPEPRVRAVRGRAPRGRRGGAPARGRAQDHPPPGAAARTFGITAAYSALVGLVDALSGANYMFLRRPPGEWTLLRVLGPWPWYVVSAAGVAALLFALLDLPFRSARRGGSDGRDRASGAAERRGASRRDGGRDEMTRSVP